MKKYLVTVNQLEDYADKRSYVGTTPSKAVREAKLEELPPGARVLTRDQGEYAYMKKRKDVATIDDRDNCNRFLNYLFGEESKG